VSPEEAEKEDEMRNQRLKRDKDKTLQGQQSPSVYSAEDTSSNGHASSQDGTTESRGRVRGVKGWWKKTVSTSRPGTPVGVR